jgi:hypothetical protein
MKLVLVIQKRSCVFGTAVPSRCGDAAFNGTCHFDYCLLNLLQHDFYALPEGTFISNSVI